MKRLLRSCGLILSFLMTLTLTVHADTPVYQGDPNVMARLDELARMVGDLQKVVSQQQIMLERQNLEIGALRNGQVEKQTPAMTFAPPPKEVTLPKWAEGITWGGDLRLRYEALDSSSKSVRDYNRFRFRLRYGFEKAFNEDMKIGVRLASGQMTDPTSVDQTMGQLFTEKGIYIDRAYAIYNPKWVARRFGRIQDVKIGAGKFENPYKVISQMVWDYDVEPEGAYEHLSVKLTNKISAYTTLGQFILTENTTAASDSELFAYKGGLNFDLNDAPWLGKYKPKLNSSAAYYDYSNYAHNSNFDGLAGRNTNLNGDGTLDAKAFKVLDIYNEYSMSVFERTATFFSDYAVNLDEQAPYPDGQRNAWGIGIRYGSLKQKGDWQVGYGYYHIEANAVVGAFNTGDFGIGHSNNRGSEVLLAYQLTDFLMVQTSGYFFNRISDDVRNNEAKRFRVDMTWKF